MCVCLFLVVSKLGRVLPGGPGRTKRCHGGQRARRRPGYTQTNRRKTNEMLFRNIPGPPLSSKFEEGRILAIKQTRTCHIAIHHRFRGEGKWKNWSRSCLMRKRPSPTQLVFKKTSKPYKSCLAELFVLTSVLQGNSAEKVLNKPLSISLNRALRVSSSTPSTNLVKTQFNGFHFSTNQKTILKL